MNAKRIVGVVAVVVLVAGLVGVRMVRVREKEAAATLTRPSVVVEIARVRQGSLHDGRQFLGDVVAAEETPLSARVVSQVLRVDAREGDVVRRGQRLIDLDPRELDDAAAAADAGIAAARESLTAADVGYTVQQDASARDKVLADAGAIAREDWERSQSAQAAALARREAARAQVTQAQRSADSARTRRGYTRIDAPFDAVVSARWINAGDLAIPGKPLLTLVRPGPVRIRVRVPAEMFGDLSVGQAVGLTTPAGRQAVSISRVFPAMDASRLATFEADVPTAPPGFPPGATIGVDLPREGPTGVIVPADALLEGASQRVVFLVRDGTAHVVAVEIVARSRDGVVVRGALHDGDTVAVGGRSRLMRLGEGVAVDVADAKAGR